MIRERQIIKVDAAITPIHYTKRTEPVLTAGADYYVCFGNYIAYPINTLKIFLKIFFTNKAMRIRTKWLFVRPVILHLFSKK